jgi:hypothetical protein
VSLPDQSEVQQAIRVEWRPTFSRIADALAAENYCLEPGIPGVAPVSASTASQIRANVRAYGATLTALPATTWESSACIWAGDHWDAIVDLWTEEEGRSDMVLHAFVFPTGSAFSIEVHAVYVP